MRYISKLIYAFYFHYVEREVPECEVDRECSVGHICENNRCVGKIFFVLF